MKRSFLQKIVLLSGIFVIVTAILLLTPTSKIPSSVLLGTFVGTGAFTNQVIGTTATQAILTYTAPDANSCSITVKDDQGQLVKDVDPAIFTTANLDTRNSALSLGTSRIFIIGKRVAEKGIDGKFYSRALQANTTHTYIITCGNKVASGSFTTSNIPIGNNYHDPLPADLNNPGSYAYPTFTGDRNQQVIDPQTGLLIRPMTVASDNANLGFGAAGFTDMCSADLVPDVNSNLGYHCLISSKLIWINSNTGETRLLSDIGISWPTPYFGPCYTGITLDPHKGNTLYCSTGEGGVSVLYQIDYEGDNRAGNLSSVLPNCASAAAPCFRYTMLTPPAQSKDIEAQVKALSSEYVQSGFTGSLGWYMVGDQNGRLTMYRTANGQDTVGWFAIFDIATRKIIAVTSTWRHAPLRWGVLHNGGFQGDVDWLDIGLNTNARYVPQSYYSKLTSDLDTTVQQCPINTFGASGVACSTVNIDGEPCSPTSLLAPFLPANPSKCADPSRPYYLQDMEEGDYIFFPLETSRLIKKISTTKWVIQRNINPPRFQPTGTAMAPDTGLGNKANGGAWSEAEWDYINDPFALNVNGLTVVNEINNNATHASYRPNVKVESGQIRQGAIPNFINAPRLPVLIDGPFAGVSEP